MNRTTKRTLTLTLALAALTTLPALAQRGGGGHGGGGNGGGMGQGQGQGQGQGGGYGQMGGQGQGQGQGQRQRIHNQAPEQKQLRDCDGSAAQARDRARDLARSARGSQFDAEAARRDRDRIHQDTERMLAGYEQFRQGLGPDETAQLGDRQRGLDQTREQLHQHLGALDAALDAPSPDREQVAERARDVARATRDWQRQMRQLGAKLDS